MQNSASRMKKIVMITIAGLCLGIGTAAVFIPSILSTRYVKEQLVNRINKKIPGSFEVEEISLSWFGAQKAKGLALMDPTGQKVLNFEAIEIETPLWTLLRKGPVGGNTRLKSLFAEIKKNALGKTNLEESLGNGPAQIHFPITDSLILTNVDAAMEYPHSSDAPLSIVSSGETMHGDVSGNFKIEFKQGAGQNRSFAEVANFPTGVLDGLLGAKNPELSGIFHALLGDSIDLSIRDQTQDGESSLQLKASSPNLSVICSGNLSNGIFSLSTPAKAVLKVTPEGLKLLSSVVSELHRWSLIAPTEVVLDIAELQFPLRFLQGEISKRQMETLVLNSQLSLQKAELVDNEVRGNQTRIRDFSFNIDSANNLSPVRVSSEGSYYYGHTPLQYRLETQINKPKSIENLISNLYYPLEIKFSIDNLSTAIIDDILGTNHAAANAFGDHLSLLIQSNAQNPHEMRVNINSDKVEIMNILLNVDQLLSQNHFDQDWSGTLSVEQITFKNSNEKPTVRALTVPWKISNNFQNLAFSFSGTTSSQGQLQGNINGTVKIDSFKTLENARMMMSVKGTHVPAPFLEFVSGRHEIGLLFGHTLQLEAGLNIKNMKGNITAKLAGENGRFSLNGNLSDSALQLNEPLTVITQGNREIGTKVLGQIAPIFRDMVYSDQPIALTVSPENFHLPLNQFQWEDFKVGSAVLEMGRLTFNNTGNIRELLNVLKSARSEQITIWTTPLYISIDRGVMSIYRMDMLIMDRYPVATWGKIDLIRDNVQMVIGLSGTALSRALGIGGLDKDAMVQIPVKGTTGNPRIDSSKATTKIGALIAQSSKGPEGIVLGTVLDMVNGKEGNVPPPTTNPLPWADRDVQPQEQISERDRYRVSPGSKDPMKEMQKGASNLLKGFFR